MELNSINRRICELIARKLCGKETGTSLLPEEEKELESWLEKSQQNKLFYQRLSDPEYMKEKIDKYRSVDVEKYLEKFKDRTGMKSYYLFGRFYRQQIAAVAAIVLCAVAFAWLYTSEKADRVITEADVVASNILPGSSNAVLVMDNGTTVDLGKDTGKELREEDGTLLTGDSLSLNYERKEEPLAEKKELINRIVIPTGGEYRLVLSDGTCVFLNSQSRLTYPVRFQGDRRVVALEGEAYFQVAPDKKHPFVVETRNMDVRVTGTEFNLKAYADEKSVQMTLVSGVVSVFSGEEKQEELAVVPDQQVECFYDRKEIHVRMVDARLYSAWKDGMFVFCQDRLEDIMNTLARWYGMEVVFKDERLKDIRYAGKLDRSGSIVPILNVLRSTEHIAVELEDKRITLGMADGRQEEAPHLMKD